MSNLEKRLRRMKKEELVELTLSTLQTLQNTMTALKKRGLSGFISSSETNSLKENFPELNVINWNGQIQRGIINTGLSIKPVGDEWQWLFYEDTDNLKYKTEADALHAFIQYVSKT